MHIYLHYRYDPEEPSLNIEILWVGEALNTCLGSILRKKMANKDRISKNCYFQ